MAERRMMAVDLGASGGKCFVGTLADDQTFRMDEVHRFAHEGVSFFIANRKGELSERTVWDDTLIYHHIVQGLHAYRREVADTLDTLAVDTWGADGHLVSADGDLLGKVYCYRDHRLDDMIDQVKARIDARRIYELTGIHFQPFNITNQLLWLVQNRPELFLPGAKFLPVPTLFTFYLCGKNVVDSTWASVTQLMDAKTREWSDEILDALGLPRDIMPPIVAPGTAIGELTGPLALSVGLNEVRVLTCGAHDTASAFAAAPISDPNEALIISSGTWSLVGKLIPEPITSREAMEANISNEGGIGNIRCLKNCMGSWLVQELRRLWRLADGVEMSWEELNDLTRKAPAFTAFIDPDDPVFFNPANMEKAIADYCLKTAQTVPADRGTFMRVVYESLALKYRYVNAQICRISNTATKVVNIVGGGCKNTMLNQFTANALGLPVLAGPEEATAVGNLMVQAMGCGWIADVQAAQPIIKEAFAIKEYQPSDPRAWEAAFATFLKVIDG